MIHNHSLILLLLFCVYSVESVFPTPKNELFVEGEFLEISDVCKLRLVMAEGEENTHKLMSMFKAHNTDSRYYLNKILKRKNNNLHCTNDKTILN